MIWCIKTYIIAYVKKKIIEDVLSILSIVQPNVARTTSWKAWHSPAEYPSRVARCDIKGPDGTMLNPIYWKKVQGQKHPGRLGIVEHQKLSTKVLFKTNAKSHKRPGIKLLSS